MGLKKVTELIAKQGKGYVNQTAALSCLRGTNNARKKILKGYVAEGSLIKEKRGSEIRYSEPIERSN